MANQFHFNSDEFTAICALVSLPYKGHQGKFVAGASVEVVRPKIDGGKRYTEIFNGISDGPDGEKTCSVTPVYYLNERANSRNALMYADPTVARIQRRYINIWK
jgi:hypothetical protein